ncbi:hypothetical protein HDU92_003853 [Lobulomyces angularis]|nr:hypothetical protein HDU92_003853 [Lobulomyces angularis]
MLRLNRSLSTCSQKAVSSLVEPKWLVDNMKSVKILDCSWHLQKPGKGAKDYSISHLKESLFFDVDAISDTSSNFPHMLPSSTLFERLIGIILISDMGISNDDHLVLYDHGGVFSAFRVYWTFKVFGHQKISVLNGGMDAWNKGNFETTSKISKIVNRERYHTKFDSTLLTTYKNIIENIETKEKQVIDARSKERFYGQVPEPRIGIHSGHIPNSINVPFNTLIDKSTSSLLKEDELAKVFLGQGVDLNKPIITTCGSGVTAAVLYFALKQLGVKEVSVFDGSWSEYASYAESPIDCKNTL